VDLQCIDRSGTSVAGCLGIVIKLTDDVDHCALSPKAVDLRWGRDARNKDLGLHAEYPGGPGNSNPVVTARGGDEPVSGHTEAEGRVQAAAGLEGACVLQRLKLQYHRLRKPEVTRCRPQHGRSPKERRASLDGGGDIGTGRHRDRGHGTLSNPCRNGKNRRKSSLCKVMQMELSGISATGIRVAACTTDPS